ncbi:MAG: SPOR domain-containing protein [Nitrosospira sp.]|nr:SPOR domain-containing protein [Nitrosospira sp.]
MKTLFFLLLFINLVVAGYILWGPGTFVQMQLAPELQPEKIRTLAVPATCLKWGNFIDADLERVDAAIAERQLDEWIKRKTVGKVAGYWVYMPPLRDKQHAQIKMGELRGLGINAYSHVQDNSEWNNAISFGFFASMDEASNFLAALRNKRVRSAIIGEHSLEQTKLVLRDPPENVVRQISELKEEFPGSEVETTRCESRER